MKKVIFIKLGGSLITDKNKPFVARKNVIRRLALEIKQAIKGKNIGLVLAHGSGSFGHSVAVKYKTQEGIKGKNGVWGVAEVSDAAIRINRIVTEEFLKVGLSVVSFAPKSFILAKSGKVKEIFEQPLIESLELSLIPVVYGDVVMDIDKGCAIFSSERIITELIKKLRSQFKIEKIIYCGNTEGVYNPEGLTIPVIDSKVYKKVIGKIGGSTATDVTGGMLHKVQEAMKVARIAKCEVIIMSGIKEDLLTKIIKGMKIKGTVIKP